MEEIIKKIKERIDNESYLCSEDFEEKVINEMLIAMFNNKCLTFNPEYD